MARARRSPEVERPSAHPEPDGLSPFDDGVDETLIRWMLSLTPTERLQWAQDMVDTVEALREGREP